MPNRRLRSSVTRSHRGNGSESRSLIGLGHGNPRWDDALRQAHNAGLRLAVEDEIAVVHEELGHLRRRDADETDLHALGAHLVGPPGFVLVVDERRQHERDVAVHHFFARPLHLVPGAGQDGRQIRHVHAGDVVKLLLDIDGRAGHARKRIETRSVAADHGVLTDEPAARL